MTRPATRSWRAHVQIMRFDHWIKNALVIPGIVVALTVEPDRLSLELLPRLIVGFLAIGLVASSNYAINELLDAPYDLQHPTKSQRPVPRGAVDTRLAWLQWIALMAGGVAIGLAVSVPFALTLLTFWVFGTLYNLEPVRTKDVPYLDVATEALNNPIRLLAGWFIVGLPFSVIPVSLVLSYWMIGGYFMAIKRYAELRNVASAIDMSRYRPVFAAYTEPRLLTTVVFYASAAMLFLGAFTMRYRMELVLSFPFIAVVMAHYLLLSFRPDSAVQAPEKLYREWVFMAAVLLCGTVMAVLLNVDIPALYRIFRPTLPLPD